MLCIRTPRQRVRLHATSLTTLPAFRLLAPRRNMRMDKWGAPPLHLAGAWRSDASGVHDLFPLTNSVVRKDDFALLEDNADREMRNPWPWVWQEQVRWAGVRCGVMPISNTEGPDPSALSLSLSLSLKGELCAFMDVYV